MDILAANFPEKRDWFRSKERSKKIPSPRYSGERARVRGPLRFHFSNVLIFGRIIHTKHEHGTTLVLCPLTLTLSPGVPGERGIVVPPISLLRSPYSCLLPPMSSTSIIRLTPPGRSAVASIRVEGEKIAEILKHLRSENASRSTPVFARFPLDGLETREEVVLHILDENRLEIHSHGGEAVVAAIMQMLRKQFGATEIPWSDWIVDDQAAGKSEQVKKAIALIPYAKTGRIAQILVDQYHGA